MKPIANKFLTMVFSYFMDNMKSEERKIVVRLSSDSVEPKYKETLHAKNVSVPTELAIS